MAWLYLVFVGAAALGLLLAGIGICVEAHTNRRRQRIDAGRPHGLRDELAADLARVQLGRRR
ncbi:hypothetical protein [Pseudonocardia sp. WMMC193]|uniref:hypothetical protein n=1 Tax=Pseudonocardia sp. WMMC193 TaxID=2911965 RepID=UPI001F16204D|nr:hypothetical protein [Pseudonocardia sp. WMMC193]MCF7550991.1 hypothetical protein [Pseudonocardia sp. WMMC193]